MVCLTVELAISDDDLLMGSPGAYYWQGKVDLANLKVKARNDSLPKEAWESSKDFAYLGLSMAVTKKIGNRCNSFYKSQSFKLFQLLQFRKLIGTLL
jgi:hypothetical protein